MKRRTMKQIRASLLLSAALVGVSNIGGAALTKAMPQEEVAQARTTIARQATSDKEYTDTQVAVIQEKMRQAPEQEYETLGQFEVTAYCPCTECSGNWGSQTATQTTAQQGRTVAVDPNVIPLGTEIYLDGKKYICEDVGAAVKGKVIDIYFEDHQEAENFGRQHAEVRIKK